MIPEMFQHVKCFLRNASVIEGTVVEWGDEVVLKSIDDQSLLIIHAPLQDIMLTKVVLSEPTEEVEVEDKPDIPGGELTLQQQVRQKLQEVQKPIEDSELHAKNIKELREMVLAQEHQIIANKKREHFGSATAPKRTQYASSLPTYIKK